MHVTKKQIAESFSNGNFEFTYPHLSDQVEWHTISTFDCKGKTAVIVQCEKAASYFASITTYFRQINLIEDNNNVVITGTAEFYRNAKRIEFISACDVYEFDSDTKLAKITSYCLIDNEDLK